MCLFKYQPSVMAKGFKQGGLGFFAKKCVSGVSLSSVQSILSVSPEFHVLSKRGGEEERDVLCV